MKFSKFSFIWFLGLFLFGQNLCAQTDYKLMSDQTAVRTGIKNASDALKTLQADFVQIKNLSVLEEKIQSTGVFAFADPSNVRWEYLKPFRYLIVIKDGLMTIKNEGKENKVAMESSPIFKQINNLMLSTVKGDLLLNKDFDSKVFENANSYKLELTPKQAQMKEFIAKIVIILDKKDFSVNSIRMIEPAGDDTFISFTNKRNNAALPKDIFVVR